MGWRSQDARDRDESERWRAHVRALPWPQRVAVYARGMATAGVLAGMAAAIAWIVWR